MSQAGWALPGPSCYLSPDSPIGGRNRKPATGCPVLSVVIPTLNAADALAATIAALREAAGEVIVCDGGSVDRTAEIAAEAGAIVLSGAALRGIGRGGQLAAGAARARGDWLLFLHADTVPGGAALKAAQDFMADPENLERAAVFRLALDEPDPAPGARRIEAIANWRSRVLGLPYGDQGLLIARAFYESLGGYRPIRLMEDVDIVRRIGRRRLEILDVPAVTSARRYRAGGFIARPLRNIFCLTLYFLGVPPDAIARIYER